MTYTNEEFKDDLTRYLQAKQAKQAARSQKAWFFRTVCSDPAYQAKVNFVENLIERIDSGKNDRVERLVLRGVDGQEGFGCSVTHAMSSRLLGLLLFKCSAMAEERAPVTQHHRP